MVESRSDQRLDFAGIRRPIEHRPAENDTRDVPGMRLVILEREDGSPRMTVDEPLLDLERASQRVKLLNEARNLHERSVREPIGLARPELVVADDGPVVADILEGLEIIASRAGAAVQENHRCSTARARHLVPDTSTANRKHPFTGGVSCQHSHLLRCVVLPNVKAQLRVVCSIWGDRRRVAMVNAPRVRAQSPRLRRSGIH